MSPSGQSTLSPVGDLSRVGSGEPCEDNLAFRTYVCYRDEVVARHRMTCNAERSCPTCSPRWAWGEAIRAVHRMMWWVKARSIQLAPRHVVVSWFGGPLRTRRDLELARREAAKVLKGMGVVGAALVVHGERHRGRDCWYDGPHVHAIATGRVDAERRPDGVFVRTLRPAQRSLRSTVAYLLNHATVAPRGHALTWWGAWAYNRAPGCPKYVGATGPACPVCGEPMEFIEDMIARTLGRFQVLERATGGGLKGYLTSLPLEGEAVREGVV